MKEEIYQIVCGDHHFMILKLNGDLLVCGSNDYGQLGTGSRDDINIPQLLMKGEIIKVACGMYHSMILKSNGEFKKQVQATKEALKVAKVEIEDHLSEDLLDQEIEDDLNQEIEESIDEATSSAKGLGHTIDVLTRLASQAAEKQQAKREEALRHAIEAKNEALIKQQEKALELEDKKQERYTMSQKHLRDATVRIQSPAAVKIDPLYEAESCYTKKDIERSKQPADWTKK